MSSYVIRHKNLYGKNAGVAGCGTAFQVFMAIRNAFPVKKVTSSHTKKESVILAEQEIPEPELRKVIAETGYDVTSVNWEPYEKKGLFSRR